MLRFLMIVAVVTVSAMVSGAAGMFMGARSATEAGGWLDRARNAFRDSADGATAAERRAAVQRRLAAELDAVPPARERWAASERDRWNGGSPDRRDARPGIRNTRYEDDRWSDDAAGRRMNREARRDGRERRLRDDEQNSRDRRSRYDDRYEDRYDHEDYENYDEPRRSRRNDRDRDRAADRGDRRDAEPVRDRIEVVVRTETAKPAASPAAAPTPPAPQAAAPPQPPTVLAAHTGHLPAATMTAPIAVPEPGPERIEITVPAGTVIEVDLGVTISTETARLEDRVDGTVARGVRIKGRTVIPAGTRVRGTVSNADDGGRLKGAARLAVRFHELTLDDGTIVEFSSRSFERVGPSPGRTTATRTGGAAAVGALIGGIFGGERGAAIGGSIGAAGGAASSAGSSKPVTFHTGTAIPVTLTHPARVVLEG